MHHLSIRNVPPELSAALDAKRREQGTSLNRTVIELLARALGVARPRDNGLGKYAGTWTESEADAFDEVVAVFEHVDDEVWK